ncbi:hypothetical protein TA3x_003790 [Tundrisphaera sp. TA3]|uniref:hypothetical protein n=1 Tax=Tundrisphaera sp. TA3 TaxID=3435775 RepID=UPI003EBA525A
MKRFTWVACAVLLILTAGGRAIEPQASTPLSVRIVPTSYHEKTGRSIVLRQPSDHFAVVITNVSDRPVKLWREWCSNGYFNLSFVATGEDGEPVVVRKKPRGWDKNYPDATIVPPGDHMVLEVTFDEAIWQGLSLPGKNRSRTLKLKAEYSVEGSQQAEEHGVWVGRASSPEESFAIWK